jgi:hypothetical protein
MLDDDTHLRDDADRTAAYVDGTLDAAARAAVTAHLVGCRECRTYLAALARGLGEGAAPAMAPTAARRWLPLAASLLIAVAAGGVLLLVRPHPVQMTPATTMPPAVPPAPVTQPAVPNTPIAPGTQPPAASPDTTRSASDRHVGGKTFHLVAGEWIDRSFDPLAALPVVTVASASERDGVLASAPGLQRYLALGTRFTVVLDGTVYRVDIH